MTARYIPGSFQIKKLYAILTLVHLSCAYCGNNGYSGRLRIFHVFCSGSRVLVTRLITLTNSLKHL